MESQKTETLNLHEIGSIKIHKLLARLLYCFEHVWGWLKGIFLLFSKAARAKKLVKMGEVFESQEETKEAIEYYKNALAKCPALSEIHLNLGRCYLRQLLFKEAANHIEKFLLKNPEDAEGNLYKGILLYYTADFEGALTYLRNAENLFPEKSTKRAFAMEYIGECSLKLGRYDEGITAIEDAIKINPYSRNEKRLASLGEMYCFINKKEDALRVFQEALNLNPHNHEVWNNIGVILWDLKDKEKAYHCFEQSLALSPGYQTALSNLDAVKNELKMSLNRKARRSQKR